MSVVTSTREEIERAAHVLDEVTAEWGLTVSLPKTKLLVVNGTCDSGDLQPITIRGESIEVVSNFRYLGSTVESHGEIDHEGCDGKDRPCLESLWSLCRPVFHDGNLSLKTKRMVYRAVVLGVLLYGAETWTNMRDATQKLESFNNKCLRRILQILREQQRVGHITSVQMRKKFGVDKTIEKVAALGRACGENG